MKDTKAKPGFHLYLKEFPSQLYFAAFWVAIHLVIQFYYASAEWIYGDVDKFIFLLSLAAFLVLAFLMVLITAASAYHKDFFSDGIHLTNYLVSWFIVVAVVLYGSFYYYTSFLR